jgi:hypothetical protein
VEQDESRYNACIHYILIRGKLNVANLSTQLTRITPGKMTLRDVSLTEKLFLGW